jgi:putative N6-adenine-specific DNA methylase
MDETFEIFMVATPGFEDALLSEALANGFAGAERTQGGVTVVGYWEDVWRANLAMRGASRILARVGSFMAFHLAQLDKRARKFPWGDILRADIPVRVEVTTSKTSKIYHAGAATQRIETALKDSHGMTISADAPLTIKVRIDDNRVTISIDTSGESLHKRGHKEAVGKAPMRETLASLMLRECGYDRMEPVLDPMCGSGTFLIEAAEMAAGLLPGRSRDFAFMQLANFDAGRWSILRKMGEDTKPITQHFYGSDRDAGAVRMSRTNAERAGVADHISFENLSASSSATRHTVDASAIQNCFTGFTHHLAKPYVNASAAGALASSPVKLDWPKPQAYRSNPKALPSRMAASKSGFSKPDLCNASERNAYAPIQRPFCLSYHTQR